MASSPPASSHIPVFSRSLASISDPNSSTPCGPARGHTATPDSAASPADPCSICYVSLQLEPAHLLPCGHRFHTACIRRHAEHCSDLDHEQNRAPCPYCRADFSLAAAPFLGLQRVPKAPQNGSDFYAPVTSHAILSRMASARAAVARRMQQTALMDQLAAAAGGAS